MACVGFAHCFRKKHTGYVPGTYIAHNHNMAGDVIVVWRAGQVASETRSMIQLSDEVD